MNVPEIALNNAVEQLMALSKYDCANEHELSSLLNRTMDRFLFPGYVNLRKAGLVVVKFENRHPCFDCAKRETQCYTICSLTKSLRGEFFYYCFGLPYCQTYWNALEMHMIVGEKLQYIHIAETDFMRRDCVRIFLLLTYGAVHWPPASHHYLAVPRSRTYLSGSRSTRSWQPS